MPDEKKQSGVATEIAHCPHLGIYHYRRSDGTEYLFDGLQLERSIDSYLQQGDSRQAEFMATLTAFARKFPHQVVSFDGEGKLNLRELLASSSEEVVDAEVVGEVASGEKQISDGKKAGK